MLLEALILLGIIIVLLFGVVLLFGAPYLPTLSKRVEDALDLLALKPGQALLELGSGDGRLLKAAAKRGIRATGYELNPLLVFYTKISCWRYRDRVSVHWGNYWTKQWLPTDGIYVFMLEKYMEKLHKRCIQESKRHPFKLVSFAFKIPKKTPQKEQKGMYLYAFDKK